MKSFSSIEEILDFAIKEEEKAAEFYRDLAERVKNNAVSQIFIDFVKEEEKHKTKLLEVRSGDTSLLSTERVADLKISDYLVGYAPTANMTTQNAFLLAMKKEKAAFRLYTNLAAAVDNGAFKELLLSLAQEEAKHKLRFEIEYDDVFMDEN